MYNLGMKKITLSMMSYDLSTFFRIWAKTFCPKNCFRQNENNSGGESDENGNRLSFVRQAMKKTHVRCNRLKLWKIYFYYFVFVCNQNLPTYIYVFYFLDIALGFKPTTSWF